jgi:uncharacterized membrane protein YcaP (DUF421 family)
MRTLGPVTTFGVVPLLVVGEATQQALLGEDFSTTQAAVVIATLVGLDCASDYLSWRFGPFKGVTKSVPVILVDDGKLLLEVWTKSTSRETTSCRRPASPRPWRTSAR